MEVAVRPQSKDKPIFSEGPSVFLPRGSYEAIPLFPLPLVFLQFSHISPLIHPIPPCPPTLGVLIPIAPVSPLKGLLTLCSDLVAVSAL